jgi:23S rRNA pseudouridine955/2504/2580 synthase
MRLDPATLKKIGIIHEDDDLLAVNKPAGLASQPGEDDKRSVLEILESAYSPARELHLAHRLDRGTSGVLLLAKSAGAKRQLAESWGRARKTYVAVALGSWSGPEKIVTPIDADRGVKTAETQVLRAKAFEHELGSFSWLALELATGRMHQIRKHLAELGHPVLLDDRYGHFGTNKRLVRWLKERGGVQRSQLCLHALRLCLPHPASGELLALEAPAPAVFEQLLRETGIVLGDLLSEIP